MKDLPKVPPILACMETTGAYGGAFFQKVLAAIDAIIPSPACSGSGIELQGLSYGATFLPASGN